MYLPLTGQCDLNREENFRSPLGAKSNMQNVLPADNAHKARNQRQEHQPSKEKESEDEEDSSYDQKKDYTDKFYANTSMSTQDFIALNNFSLDKESF